MFRHLAGNVLDRTPDEDEEGREENEKKPNKSRAANSDFEFCFARVFNL